MILENGDLIYWSSNLIGDYFANYSNIIDPGHVNSILKGKEFEQLSVCGKSPTNTYIWIDLYIVMPFEECVLYFWNSKYVCNMILIKRTDGPIIDSFVYFKKYIQEVNLWKKIDHCLPLLLTSYFNLNKCGQFPRSTGVCSEFVYRQLQGVDLVCDMYPPQNILPREYITLNFQQKYSYTKITIFDKATQSKEWLISIPFICLRNLGLDINVGNWKSKNVENISKYYKSNKPKNSSRKMYSKLAQNKWAVFYLKHSYLYY